MGRRSLLALLGWLVAAAAATLTGLAGVRVIGAGITEPGGEVLTPAQVASAAGTSPTRTTTTPSAEATPSSSVVTGRREALSGPGGSVVAECVGAQVHLVSWAPAQGYWIKRADGRPDDHAEVTFEGSAGKVEVSVRCASGRPEATWKVDN